MRTCEELYEYCTKNTHTKNWIWSVKNTVVQDCERWVGDPSSQGPGAYCCMKLGANLPLGIAGDMWALLGKCAEKADFEDVCVITDWILQDIGKELAEHYRRPHYFIMMRVNSKGEGIFFWGPQTLEKDILWGDDGVFMKGGYDVLRGCLRPENTSSVENLLKYLKNEGII